MSASYIDTAERAARAAGALIMEGLGHLAPEDITAKRANDYVTLVDKRSEAAIIDIIKASFPDHGFMAEEGGGLGAGLGAAPKSEDHVWIIDPLDGTTNFIPGYPVFSVSIALSVKGVLTAAVVYDPVREELFRAEQGQGAYLNGRRLKVSATSQMRSALLTTGFPFRDGSMVEPYLEMLRGLFMSTSGLRRPGSAALDLAYTAAGRCEAFFEYGLSAWDIAAGSLLVMEAGGRVTDFGGGTEYLGSGNIVAGNPHIQPALLDHVRRVYGKAGVER